MPNYGVTLRLTLFSFLMGLGLHNRLIPQNSRPSQSIIIATKLLSPNILLLKQNRSTLNQLPFKLRIPKQLLILHNIIRLIPSKLLRKPTNYIKLTMILIHHHRRIFPSKWFLSDFFHMDCTFMNRKHLRYGFQACAVMVCFWTD